MVWPDGLAWSIVIRSVVIRMGKLILSGLQTCKVATFEVRYINGYSPGHVSRSREQVVQPVRRLVGVRTRAGEVVVGETYRLIASIALSLLLVDSTRTVVSFNFFDSFVY
jgi:hypothetical protein